MALVIRIDPEHVESWRRALISVRADKSMLEWWNLPIPIEMTLTIDDLEETIDRAEAAIRTSDRAAAVRMTEGGRRPW